MDIAQINISVLNSLKNFLEESSDLGKRDWCLLSAVDDRLKYITVGIIDVKTSLLVPIKLDRFNKLYLESNVIYGIVKGVLDKYRRLLSEASSQPFDWTKNTPRAGDNKAIYEAKIDLKSGGKIHLFSWQKSVII